MDIRIGRQFFGFRIDFDDINLVTSVGGEIDRFWPGAVYRYAHFGPLVFIWDTKAD